MGQRQVFTTFLHSLMLLGVIGFSQSVNAESLSITSLSSDPQHSIQINRPVGTIINSTITTEYLIQGTYSSNSSVIDLYCVDLATQLQVNTDYTNGPLTPLTSTYTVSTNGAVDSVGGAVTNGGAISFLVDYFYHSGNYGSAASVDQKLGLQAAIWAVEYNEPTLLIVSSNAIAATTYQALLGVVTNNSTFPPTFYTSPVSNQQWLSPVYYDLFSDQNVVGQGLVTPNLNTVPEPSSLALAVLGLLGVPAVTMVRRRFAAQQAA